MQISSITLAERIESLKAGILAALSAASLFGLTIVSHGWLTRWVELPANWQPDAVSVNLWVGWAIATLSGFLFGVTYRYVIRQDQNPHLKSGAVLAFGLVRGLAQVEAELNLHREFLPFALLIVESILLFTVARLVLDWALHQQWLQPFNSD